MVSLYIILRVTPRLLPSFRRHSHPIALTSPKTTTTKFSADCGARERGGVQAHVEYRIDATPADRCAANASSDDPAAASARSLASVAAAAEIHLFIYLMSEPAG